MIHVINVKNDDNSCFISKMRNVNKIESKYEFFDAFSHKFM